MTCCLASAPFTSICLGRPLIPAALSDSRGMIPSISLQLGIEQSYPYSSNHLALSFATNYTSFDYGRSRVISILAHNLPLRASKLVVIVVNCLGKIQVVNVLIPACHLDGSSQAFTYLFLTCFSPSGALTVEKVLTLPDSGPTDPWYQIYS